ncbi:MAG TPA: hypothetical protein PKW66_03625, partial [Polyangiaceae bacterium]|nr:hypothetical protein [Polyangiaceae bacterium]
GAVFGPMNTVTLLQGVAEGHVPTDSLVRAHAWSQWRNILQIREVSAFQKASNPSFEPRWELPYPEDEGQALARSFLRCAISSTEALLLAMHAAVELTRAEVAMVHRYRGPERAFVTSFTHGDGLEPSVGHALPGYDAACVAAMDGRGVWGSQGVGSAQRALVARLSRGMALRGVAMVPIRVMDRTYAMLELGRSDHPFRNCDKARLTGVRRALEQVFVGEGWNPWPMSVLRGRQRPTMM